MAVIANGQFLGGGFKAAPKANMSDGLLDIVILKNSGSFKMLEEFMSMKMATIPVMTKTLSTYKQRRCQ